MTSCLCILDVLQVPKEQKRRMMHRGPQRSTYDVFVAFRAFLSFLFLFIEFGYFGCAFAQRLPVQTPPPAGLGPRLSTQPNNLTPELGHQEPLNQNFCAALLLSMNALRHSGIVQMYALSSERIRDTS
jgi:hypothetical protein